MKFAGLVVVVTGAGSGIGQAMVSEFAAQGAKVAALGRTASKLRRAIANIDEAHALTITVDVSKEDEVKAAIQQILAKWDRIDLLCNNAGVLDSYRPAHEVSLEEWDKVMAINVTGPFLMAKYAIPTMLRQGKGGIINVASTASFSAAGGGSAYTASKHAILGLTKQLCFEYGSQGIRVNAICPGATATPLAIPESKTEMSPDMMAAIAKTPAGRWCQPEEIAKLASFLGSEDAGFIHGSAYVIDGGWLTAAREPY